MVQQRLFITALLLTLHLEVVNKTISFFILLWEVMTRCLNVSPGQDKMVILNKQDLRGVWALPRTFKELSRHEEIYNNETCKEKGLDKLKVIDVEYIGLEGYTAIDELESFIL